MAKSEQTTIIIDHSSSSSSSSGENDIGEIQIQSQERTMLSTLFFNPSNTLTRPAKSSSSSKKSRINHRKQYLPAWEADPSAFYLSYFYDSLGDQQSKWICWLYKETNEKSGDILLRCRLCEQYGMTKNTNGKENTWATRGFNILALDKIKLHRSNEKHKEAEKLEIERTSMKQPDWIKTRITALSRQQESIQNLIFSSIYLCNNDLPLNCFRPLCNLLEKVDVKLLPAEVSGVNYRNDTAALTFLQHVSSVLRNDLIEKIKKSPVQGWMMDESTSRSTEKNCIVYVRYLDNYEPRTEFYGLMNMEGDGSAENIVKKIKELWDKNGLIPSKTCWLATDNASTFKGVHEGVAAKLKKNHDIPCLELNTCSAHSYALVGKQAGQYLDVDGKIKTRPFIADFEHVIGKIYSYFSRSSSRQYKLKQWFDFLSMPELKFKRIFEIRWSSIRDCLKPIINNMRPGNQAVLAVLELTANDVNVTQNERAAAAELLETILDDRFLFVLHFHFDLHECVSGELTKMMQKDDISYKMLMDTIDAKKQMLSSWIKKKPDGTCSWGPSLSDYLNLTQTEDAFGSFNILSKTHRDELTKECFIHTRRLLEEIDRRFPPSQLHQYLSTLFDPVVLEENQHCLNEAAYGRLELNYLLQKYKKFPDFNATNVPMEWELLKPLLINFISTQTNKNSAAIFWKSFIQLKLVTHEQFAARFKNILILVGIYLISPHNSAECERGYSAANRIQTKLRSRITIETLDSLLTVRLLLSDDIRSVRCQEVVERAFQSWNDPESNRRISRVQLLIDVPEDYEPHRQIRSNAITRKRSHEQTTYSASSSKPKKPKASAIRCANLCEREISSDDPMQMNAILCCHQDDIYDWVTELDSCRRWLCNFCRIKLGVSTATNSWFCTDHQYMHEENE